MDGRELLKRYDAYKQEAQYLRGENRFLRFDRDGYRLDWYHAQERVNTLSERVVKLEAENRRLKQQVKELTEASRREERAGDASPQWVKASVKRRRRRPGRKVGHPAALRPVPAHVDTHQDVPLPRDPAGRASCPHCNACLLDLKDHERVVEDVVPSQVVVTCYHTASGWCPGCRHRVGVN